MEKKKKKGDSASKDERRQGLGFTKQDDRLHDRNPCHTTPRAHTRRSIWRMESHRAEEQKTQDRRASLASVIALAARRAICGRMLELQPTRAHRLAPIGFGGSAADSLACRASGARVTHVSDRQSEVQFFPISYRDL